MRRLASASKAGCGGAGTRTGGIRGPARVGPFAPLSPEARERSLRETLQAARDGGEIWVFAYASLIWRPCFDADATRRLYLPGYRRTFCIWTAEARGRPDRPGLGLGLVEDGDGCEGVALKVPSARRMESLRALWSREMLTGVYRPRWLSGRDEAGAAHEVLAFVADPAHPQYARGLTQDERAAFIASARGELGTCMEYLRNSVAALRAAGIDDPGLDAMMDLTRRAAERTAHGSDSSRSV